MSLLKHWPTPSLQQELWLDPNLSLNNSETRRWLPRDKNNDALVLQLPLSNKNKATDSTTTTKDKNNAQDVIDARKDMNASQRLITTDDTYLSDTMIWPGECKLVYYCVMTIDVHN